MNLEEDSPLLRPGRLGAATTKNRIAMPAFHLGAAQGGRITSELLSFYERRAAADVGVITVGVCNAWTPEGSPLAGVIDVTKDDLVPGLERLTSAVKAHGCVIGAQISPMFGYNSPHRAPSLEQLQEMYRSVENAAARVASAGFDFVELMLSGGSLLSHFLSPVHNRWGIPGYDGDFVGRMRAPLETIEAIRRGVGPDYLIAARMHGHELLDGGYGLEQARKIAQSLVQTGIGAIAVTGAGHRTKVPQLTHQTPSGAFAYLGRNIRSSVDVPIFWGGRLRTPEAAEEGMERSGADFIHIARALVADPDWILKARARSQSTMFCLTCCRCLDAVFSRSRASCTLNPELWSSKETPPAPQSFRVPPPKAVVLGAGPAGLQAAWSLTRAGYAVRVLEAKSFPGGRWRTAARLHGRRDLQGALMGFIARLEEADVLIETRVEATPESVRELDVDLLVVAAGAKKRTPILEGLEVHPNVLYAEEILTYPEKIGRDITVVGAGGSGVEAALHLAAKMRVSGDALGFLAKTGRPWFEEALDAKGQRRVRLLWRRGPAGKGLGRSVRWTLVGQLESLGVELRKAEWIVRVLPHGLEVSALSGGPVQIIESDTIVLATGFDPCPEVIEEFRGCAREVIGVGDVTSVGNIRDAVTSAHAAVTRFCAENK